MSQEDLFAIQRTTESPATVKWMSLDPVFVGLRMTTNIWFSVYRCNAIWLPKSVVLRMIDGFCAMGQQDGLEVVDEEWAVVDHESWRNEE